MDIAKIGSLFIGEEFRTRLENCQDDTEKGVVAEDFWIPFLFHLMRFHFNCLQDHFMDQTTSSTLLIQNYTDLLHLPPGFPTVDSIVTVATVVTNKKMLISELKDIFSNVNRAYGHTGTTRDMVEIARHHPRCLASQFKTRFQGLKTNPAKPLYAKDFRKMEIVGEDNKSDRLGIMDLFELNSNLDAAFCASNDKIKFTNTEFFTHTDKICIIDGDACDEIFARMFELQNPCEHFENMQQDIQQYYGKVKPRIRKRLLTDISTGVDVAAIKTSGVSVPVSLDIHGRYCQLDDKEKKIISDIVENAIAAVHDLKEIQMEPDKIRKILRVSNSI